MNENIAEIFKTVGLPTVTYVKRASGALENLLRSALDERGKLCLVTGPSKTGKTTLYKEVLKSRGEIPLIVACDREKTCHDIWRQALEEVNFERVESRSKGEVQRLAAEAELSGKLGWSWLAEATAKWKGMFGKDISDHEIRARVLTEPGPDLLIPLLRGSNYVLVIEDFHYLPEKEQELLFQQWKRFVDSEVSVLVLGTTHRAVDIANNNKDLLGRITQVDVGHWDVADLKSICYQGFKYLKVPIMNDEIDFIASEAVGLPIVVQQVCLNLFTSKGIYRKQDIKKSHLGIDKPYIRKCLNKVALTNYTQFKSYYETLISGPREKSRKYRTYELVLACFTRNPIKFALKRMEIDDRLSELNLEISEIPPAASLNSTFGALKQFQQRRKFELLEWRAEEDKLYILEPSFLFYVRWRAPRDMGPIQLDLFEELISRPNAA